MNKVSRVSDPDIATSDEELAGQVAAGQGEVFAELYTRYYARAHRLAWAMTGRSDTAEELTQEIFLRAWQKIAQFRGDSSFATWFYRLAVRCCLNYRRRWPARQHEGLDTIEQLSEPMTEMETSLHQQQIQTQVQRALLTLKPKWRVIVILKDIEGLSYEEIAARVNCSMGTIASRLNRARRLLAQKLEHLKGSV